MRVESSRTPLRAVSAYLFVDSLANFFLWVNLFIASIIGTGVNAVSVDAERKEFKRRWISVALPLPTERKNIEKLVNVYL